MTKRGVNGKTGVAVSINTPNRINSQTNQPKGRVAKLCRKPHQILTSRNYEMDNGNSKKTGGEQETVSLKTKKQYQRGEHPNSQANLEPFEKGQSGNPGGRPNKYIKLKKALDRVGRRKKDASYWNIEPSRETYRAEVLDRIWYEASNGSVSHIRMLAELGCLDDED